MEYKIKIKSEKEREFLRFLRVLKDLEVIEDFSSHGAGFQAKTAKDIEGQDEEDKSTYDLAQQYRDLVD